MNMKKNNFIISLLMLLAVFALTFVSCDKEEDPVELTLVSCVAGTVSINEATPPTDVTTDAVIQASFSTNIDETTVTAANITLTRASDELDVDLEFDVSGKNVFITPVEELYNGETYTLNLGAGIKSTEGMALTALTRSFTTMGTFVPTGMVAYWNFEDNADDQIGTFDPAPADAQPKARCPCTWASAPGSAKPAA